MIRLDGSSMDFVVLLYDQTRKQYNDTEIIIWDFGHTFSNFTLFEWYTEDSDLLALIVFFCILNVYIKMVHFNQWYYEFMLYVLWVLSSYLLIFGFPCVAAVTGSPSTYL